MVVGEIDVVVTVMVVGVVNVVVSVVVWVVVVGEIVVVVPRLSETLGEIDWLREGSSLASCSSSANSCETEFISSSQTVFT